MSTSDSSWLDLIPPDHPRYESWLLMRAFIQRQHNAATEEFLSAFQKGSVQLADILKYFGGMFDGLVEPIVMAVTSTELAERFARNLDRGSEEFLEVSRRWFPVVETSTGIDANSLETEFNLLLAIRVAAWKKKAFHMALENEPSRVKKVPESESSSASRGPSAVGSYNAQGRAERAMTRDTEFWRKLRADFEALQGHQFDIIWTSQPARTFQGESLESNWQWARFPDKSLLERLRAIALRGAKGLGHDSEDAWYDELRRSGFVEFDRTGDGQYRLPDGRMVKWESGTIENVPKHSISLCFRFEALSAETRAEGRGAVVNRPAPKKNEALAQMAQSTDTVGGIIPRLNVELINKWIKHEGYDNKELATRLNISVRTVSSLRNNGAYHGEDAVTKLANLMNTDVEDLYLA